MGKITVKHYLNKELNPTQKSNKYPVYVQVITLRKNLRFRSNNGFFTYLSDEDMKSPNVLSLLKKEKTILEYIVSDLIRKGLENGITSKNLNMYSSSIDDIIETNFPTFLRNEAQANNKFIPKLLLGGSYSEINEIIDFFNDDSPFMDISEKFKTCLSAIHIIKEDTLGEHFYVYDLFGGEKYEQIVTLMSKYSSDEESVREKLSSLMLLAYQ